MAEGGYVIYVHLSSQKWIYLRDINISIDDILVRLGLRGYLATRIFGNRKAREEYVRKIKGGTHLNEKFKKEVEKHVNERKANVQDKGLYNIIEKIIKQDPAMKKWIEEE